MLKISTNIEIVDYERRKEIITRAKDLHEIVNDYIVNFQKTNVCSSSRTDMAYTFYKKLYKEELDKYEKTILSLYIIYPEDSEFIRKYKINNKSFEKLGNLYGVTSNFTALRYKCLLLMLKDLQEKNNNNLKK